LLRSADSFDYLLLAARLCLSAVYLYSGLDKLVNWQNGIDFVVRHRLPWPRPVLAGTIAVQLAGGSMVLLGMFAREGAALLLLFTVAATIACHNPIGLKGEAFRRECMLSLEHLAIVGGLLLVAMTGPGGLSLMPR
jgi:putative oxidoreductase